MDNFFERLLDPQTLPGAIFYGAVLLALSIAAARLIQYWSDHLQHHPGLFLDPTAAGYVGQILKLGCFLIAAIIYSHLVPALNKTGTLLLTSASVISLVLGLAAQNTLGHLIAGLAILFYRPFGIGEVILFNAPTGQETGTVRQFTIGYTELKTNDSRLVVIPNSVMISSVIIKLSANFDVRPPGSPSVTGPGASLALPQDRTLVGTVKQ
jgi:small-conductance mechanosensitive channel